MVATQELKQLQRYERLRHPNDFYHKPFELDVAAIRINVEAHRPQEGLLPKRFEVRVVFVLLQARA